MDSELTFCSNRCVGSDREAHPLVRTGGAVEAVLEELPGRLLL